MRILLATSATAFLLVSLGCARGNNQSDDTAQVDEGDTFAAYLDDVDLNCNGDEWEFSATAPGATLVEVEPWVGNSAYAGQDLIDRGLGDWFLQAPAALIGTPCTYSDVRVIFRAHFPAGDTSERAWE